MGELRKYAEAELQRAGMYDADVDYGPGEIAKCVLGMIDAFSSYEHSGGSRDYTLALFNRIIQFKPLTPITDDPKEWMEVTTGLWQSRRDPSCFSLTGGKDYYNVDEEGRPMHETAAAPSA
jgi:hypothetical protein